MAISLRQRLFVLTAVSLLPAFAVVTLNEVQTRRSRAVEVQEQALRAAKLASLEIDRILTGVENLLLGISLSSDLADRQEGGCSRYLVRLTSALPALSGIHLLDSQAQQICTSSSSPSSADYSDRGYFKEALASRKIVVGEFVKGRSSGLNALPLALAIRDDKGTARYILSAGLKLDWLGEALRERGIAAGGSFAISDRNGVLLVREPNPERFVGTQIPDTFMPLVRAAEPGTIELTSQDGTVRIQGYIPVTYPPLGLYVSVGFSKAAAFEPINRATWIALATVLVGAIIALASAAAFGRALIQGPFRRLLKAIRAWRAGERPPKFSVEKDGPEFATIGAAFDDLMRGMRAHAEQRDLMARELSHRVKNTLTIVLAIARQTVGKGPDPAGAKAFSERVDALAGAYDVLLAEDWNSASLRDVLACTLRPYQDQKVERIVLSGPHVILSPQTVLAVSMVVHELATNAAKYGALHNDAGRVLIDWRLDPATTRVVLSWIEQDGPPVAPPAKEGFGSKLMQRAFPPDCEAEINIAYPVGGLRCVVSFDNPPPDQNRAAA
jgi:two-component sensor histidine kinase